MSLFHAKVAEFFTENAKFLKVIIARKGAKAQRFLKVIIARKGAKAQRFLKVIIARKGAKVFTI